MNDRHTCGKGLAAHAALPGKLGELMASVAEILERHGRTLVGTDEATRAERAAYSELTESHRRIASELSALAERMAGCRDLPMGTHDEAALSDPGHVEAFGAFVQVERELVSLLEDRSKRDREMLDAMGGGDS